MFLNARLFDFSTTSIFSACVLTAVAHDNMVTRSLLIVRSCAEFSLDETNGLLGITRQKNPDSSALYSYDVLRSKSLVQKTAQVFSFIHSGLRR